MTNESSDIAYEFANIIYNTDFSDLSTDAIKAAKLLTLDTIGVGAAGTEAPGIPELINLLKEDNRHRVSKVLFHDLRLPPEDAALVNSSMMHAQDFDDTHDEAVIHTCVLVLPAAFAASQEIGKVDGRKFITALVLGVEVTSRLALAHKLPCRGWLYTGICGGFGAVAAASKIYGLNKSQIVDAFGLMYSRTSGNNQAELDNALSKRMQPGFSTQSAVLATRMARVGITGAKEVFEGEYGYFNTYQDGKYDRDIVLKGLGDKFEITELSIKPYPCCRFTHSSIDAALEIQKNSKFDPQEVTQINVGVNKQAMGEVCSPEDHKKNPRGIVDAQFSIPYTVATALWKGEVFLDDFAPKAIREKERIELANKVDCYVDSKIERTRGKDITPCKLEVKSRGGQSLISEVEYPKGNPNNPMSFEEVEEKVLQCAELYIGKPTRNQIKKLSEKIKDLENSKDIREIII